MFTSLTRIAFITLVLTPTAVMALQSTPAILTSSPAPQGPARGSALIGLNVFDSSGARIAEVKDLVIGSSGQVTTVVQRQVGGLTGLPLSSLSPQLATRAPQAVPDDTPPTIERFVFAGDIDRLGTASVIQNSSALDDAWVAETQQHFSLASDATPVPSPTSRRALRLQDLSRHRLDSTSGERLGELRDIAVDLADGRVSYLVFSSRREGQSSETFHGVALDSLLFDDSLNGTLAVDRKALEQSPGLNLERLPRDPSLRIPAQAVRSTTTEADRADTGQGSTASATEPTLPR